MTLRIENFASLDFLGRWTAQQDLIELRPGEDLTLVGSCASGKTYLSLLLNGIAPRSKVRGSAYLGGRAIAALDDIDRTRRIAYVPTNPTLLFSGLSSTLLEELTLGWRMLGLAAREGKVLVDEAVAAFCLSRYLERDPFSLSGGESARAAIALAALKRPALLVVDQAYDYFALDWAAEIPEALRTFLPSSTMLIKSSLLGKRLSPVLLSNSLRPRKSDAPG